MIENCIFLKFMSVWLEQGMLDDVGEGDSSFAIDNKYFFEKIFDVLIDFF